MLYFYFFLGKLRVRYIEWISETWMAERRTESGEINWWNEVLADEVVTPLLATPQGLRPTSVGQGKLFREMILSSAKISLGAKPRRPRGDQHFTGLGHAPKSVPVCGTEAQLTLTYQPRPGAIRDGPFRTI